MTKRLITILAALICTVMTATAFASDSVMKRDHSIWTKGWKQIAVTDVAMDEMNADDTFLRDALTYELLRIGEDKYDDLTYQYGDREGIVPDAYLTVELKQYEKKRYWVNASSDAVERRYTSSESYRDREGNERTRYITRIETEIEDYPPGYTYHSYVHAKISVIDAEYDRPAFVYEAIDDGDKSTIDIYRDIVEDFYKKWKKEMKK